MINLTKYTTNGERDAFYDGIIYGIREGATLPNRKNVNTGEPLTVDELVGDFRTLQESAQEYLYDKLGADDAKP